LIFVRKNSCSYSIGATAVGPSPARWSGSSAANSYVVRTQLESLANYNGIVVFDTPNLHGGGLWYEQDFSRQLLELGLRRCERLFEFCAGPGYIGYSLLAHGFCNRLVFADVNAAAIEIAKYTRYNGIEHLTRFHVSSGLDDIPSDERWDLVVGNPPHFLPGQSGFGRPGDIRLFDPDWSIHRNSYSAIKRFMSPGGHVVFVESGDGSSASDFEPMIKAGGGRVLAARRRSTLRGNTDSHYYVVSVW